MTASLDDKITRTFNSVNPVVGKVIGTRTSGGTDLVCENLAGWPTESKVHFCEYRLDTDDEVIQASVRDWEGIVIGDTITDIHLLAGAVDDGSVIGAFVEMNPTASWADDLAQALLVGHNSKGDFRPEAVKAALGITGDTPPDWNLLPVIPEVVSIDGQKSATIKFPGVDYTNTLQEGTKLRIPRTSTVPTQSMKFEAASSQYASKTAPTGITFTDDFTCEAWVYLDSYPTGTGTQNSGTVISRYNAAGWILRVNADGMIMLSGHTASVSQSVASSRPIPTGRWVHIAAALDMSAGAGAIYIDGVLAPSIMTGSGTSLTQAGNLQAGAFNGSDFINGKVAQCRVWSTIRTAQQIRDNMGVQLATAASLVANFPGNGSFNDVSGNGNNLTANGGAIATYASNPFSAIEYAVVTTAPVFAGGNTTSKVVSVNSIIPNETLGTASYSNSETPYGYNFPKNGTPHGVVYTDTTNVTSPSSMLKSMTVTGLVIGRTYIINNQSPILNANATGTTTYSVYVDGAVVAGESITQINSAYMNPRMNVTGFFIASSTTAVVSLNISGNGNIPGVTSIDQRTIVYSVPSLVQGD